MDNYGDASGDELRVVRRGRYLIVPVSELERWLDGEAARWAS